MQAPHGQFVDRLRRKQRELGLSQAKLGAKLGVTEAHISLVLRGKRRVTLDFARAVIARWPEFSGYMAADLGASPSATAPEDARKETAET